MRWEAAVVLLGVAVSLAPFVRLPRLRPRLHGDGKHDDTRALQALFDGRRVRDTRTRRVIGPPFTLHGGQYRISKAIYLNDQVNGLITSCEFIGNPGLRGLFRRR